MPEPSGPCSLAVVDARLEPRTVPRSLDGQVERGLDVRVRLAFEFPACLGERRVLDLGGRQRAEFGQFGVVELRNLTCLIEYGDPFLGCLGDRILIEPGLFETLVFFQGGVELGLQGIVIRLGFRLGVTLGQAILEQALNRVFACGIHCYSPCGPALTGESNCIARGCREPFAHLGGKCGDQPIDRDAQSPGEPLEPTDRRDVDLRP